MKMREVVEPAKYLYMLDPGFGEYSFNRGLNVRIHELFAQKCGLNATDDLGFIGCCAVARTKDLVPEVWVDFLFRKACDADRNEFNGKASYFPKKEFKCLENVLFAGDLMKSAKVVMRDLPTFNKKGEVVDVRKKVGVLRIYGQLAMCAALIVNTNILHPDFRVRFAYMENGNRYLNEYVDADIINNYLPIDVSVTVNANAEKYDEEQIAMAIQESNENLISRPAAATVAMNNAEAYDESRVTVAGKKAHQKPNKKKDDKKPSKDKKDRHHPGDKVGW